MTPTRRRLPVEGTGGLLVVGDDGSMAADVAWLWVSNQRWPGWRAEVVTATPPPSPSRAGGAGAAEWESPHPRLRFTESQLASVRHLTAAADPRLLLGDRMDATLLVVGPSGVGQLRGLLTGSTTEWLLQHAPAPLVVVRSARPVRRVLLCVDGSAEAQAAVDTFARLPWAAQTRVHVLGVQDGRSDVAAGGAAATAPLAAAGIHPAYREVRGRPASVILEQLDELRPDLVVLGTHGSGEWRPLRLGSTVLDVVRDAPCASLIVGPAERAAPLRRRARASTPGAPARV